MCNVRFLHVLIFCVASSASTIIALGMTDDVAVPTDNIVKAHNFVVRFNFMFFPFHNYFRFHYYYVIFFTICVVFYKIKNMLIVKYIDFNFFLAYNKDVEKKGEKYGCNIFKTWNCSFYRHCWCIYLFQRFNK